MKVRITDLIRTRYYDLNVTRLQEKLVAVMGQLEAWFNDYNENAPHKGLKMRSLRPFRREMEQKSTG